MWMRTLKADAFQSVDIQVQVCNGTEIAYYVLMCRYETAHSLTHSLCQPTDSARAYSIGDIHRKSLSGHHRFLIQKTNDILWKGYRSQNSTMNT